MELTDSEIDDLRECWKADGGGDITREAARSEALRLLDFFTELEEALRRAERASQATETQPQQNEVLPLLPKID